MKKIATVLAIVGILWGVNAVAADFNNLFAWTAAKIKITVDPQKPLPKLVYMPLNDLQALKPNDREGVMVGLYDGDENIIYIAKKANDGVVVHEIVHYFQLNYKLKIPVDFFEMHAQIIEGAYCELMGLAYYRPAAPPA